MSTRGEIKAMLVEGLSVSEIARRLGLARPTVEYHAERLARPTAAPPPELAEATVPPTARSSVKTRDEVARLLAEGRTKGEIARSLGIAKSTVSYHARRLGTAVDPRGARRYEWQVVQEYYDAGHSVRECQERFGFSRQTWHAAVKRGAVTPRPHGLPLAELLVSGVHRGRHNIKLRLVRSGLKEEQCERCGIREWLARPLTFALHHVNGDRHDNRIENLEFLCPNCHSQTDTFAGRNGRRPQSISSRPEASDGR
jgi:DNA-binding CsgD family transcriptional regulator